MEIITFVVSLILSLFFGWIVTKMLVNLPIGFIEFIFILLIVYLLVGHVADYLGIINVTAWVIGVIVATAYTMIYEALKID